MGQGPGAGAPSHPQLRGEHWEALTYTLFSDGFSLQGDSCVVPTFQLLVGEWVVGDGEGEILMLRPSPCLTLNPSRLVGQRNGLSCSRLSLCVNGDEIFIGNLLNIFFIEFI